MNDLIQQKWLQHAYERMESEESQIESLAEEHGISYEEAEELYEELQNAGRKFCTLGGLSAQQRYTQDFYHGGSL